MLFMPYFVVLFFEFGTTISFGYAFSPKRLTKGRTGNGSAGSTGADTTRFRCRTPN